MKKFQRLELLALLLSLAGPVVAGELPTVAVVDFISTNGPVDGVMLGAADLLEAELSRYDVRVITRRELNVLRGERGLARGGVVRIEDFQGGALPWADFLLRGEHQYTPGESGVRFRLVDAATGTERGSWQLLVERPGDLVKNLDPILPKIAAAVCGGKVAPPRPRDQVGFTAIPEAASTFFHGMDHLVAGRPEYAAEYFRIAAADDTNFALAVLGQAKAYELLGFPRVAEAVRATIPSGQLPQAQAAGTSAVLTVRFVNRSDVFTPGQMQRIRTALQEAHGFALFEPDWIPALTRETDLKLSDDFPLVHGLDHRLWLRADHVLVFSAEKKGLSASVIDLLHGQLLGTVTGGSTNLDALCAQAVAVIRKPDVASLAPLSRIVDTNGPAVRLTGIFSVDEIAFALRRLADQPKDMACWSHLMVLIQAHPGYQVAFRAFVPSFEAAIPRDAPDTPVWLAAAGWMSYVYDAEKAGRPLPMEGYFTELLERYPDHLQAHVVRYNAALVPGYRGDYALSLPGVLEAETKVAEQVADLPDFVPMRGCRIDAISQVNYDSFPSVLPPHGPRMTMLARGVYSSAAYLYREMGDLAQAERHWEKQRPLEGRILYGSEVRHHFGGPMTIFPTMLGLWQTGHIGYEWQPADPADVGRVLVGWTFMPYPLPGWQTVQAESQPQKQKRSPATAPGAHPATKPQAKASAAAARPRSSEEQAWLDYQRDNPGLEDQLRAQAKRLREADEEIRRNPAVARTGGIFLPQNRAVSSPLHLERDNLGLHYNLLAHLERGAGRELTLADVTADDPDASMYVMGLFARGTVQALRRGGLEAGLRFACDFIAAYGEKRDALSRAWGDFTYNVYLAEMYWMTAGALERVGDVAGARLTCKNALGEGLDHPLVPSLRYLEARLARRAGQAFEASESLHALIGDPKSKDLPLRLPDEAGDRDTVYAESVALLAAIRRDEGHATAAEPPPWATPLSAATRKKPTAAVAEPSPPPRFGHPHVCKLRRGIGMEFVWIEPMQIWAAKYEMTEGEWYSLMFELTDRQWAGLEYESTKDEWYPLLSTNKPGVRLPYKVSYEQAMEFCTALNKREEKTLPAGYSYRVPTVEEWERLARCGTDRIYPWGNTMPPTFGNYSDETLADARGRDWIPIVDGYRDGYVERAPVEASGKNEWGLYGMGGNLWDWATTATGDSMAKCGTWLHAGDMLRIDAGLTGIYKAIAPGGSALRCVLAPTIAK